MSAPEGIKPEVWEAAEKLDSLPLDAGIWSMTIIDAYRQAWIREERERIIALLEQHQCTFTDTEIVECWCGSFNEAIALIKGESA